MEACSFLQIHVKIANPPVVISNERVLTEWMLEAPEMATDYVPYDGPIVTRKAAVDGGFTRYFTGKPCKLGHVSERWTNNSNCFVCGKERLNAWNRAHPDVVKARGQRRDADKVRATFKAWAALNRGTINKNRNARRASDPGRYRAEHKAWRDANRDALRLYRKARYAANPQRFRDASNAYNAVFPEKNRAKVHAWIKANPEKARAQAHVRRSREQNASGSFTGEDIKRLFTRQKGKCAYCSCSISDGYHIDHYIPLARGGSNWPSNLALACQPCNSRKHAKDPLRFARELGRLL